MSEEPEVFDTEVPVKVREEVPAESVPDTESDPAEDDPEDSQEI